MLSISMDSSETTSDLLERWGNISSWLTRSDHVKSPATSGFKMNFGRTVYIITDPMGPFN